MAKNSLLPSKAETSSCYYYAFLLLFWRKAALGSACFQPTLVRFPRNLLNETRFPSLRRLMDALGEVTKVASPRWACCV